MNSLKWKKKKEKKLIFQLLGWFKTEIWESAFHIGYFFTLVRKVSGYIYTFNP